MDKKKEPAPLKLVRSRRKSLSTKMMIKGEGQIDSISYPITTEALGAGDRRKMNVENSNGLTNRRQRLCKTRKLREASKRRRFDTYQKDGMYLDGHTLLPSTWTNADTIVEEEQQGTDESSQQKRIVENKLIKPFGLVVIQPSNIVVNNNDNHDELQLVHSTKSNNNDGVGNVQKNAESATPITFKHDDMGKIEQQHGKHQSGDFDISCTSRTTADISGSATPIPFHTVVKLVAEDEEYEGELKSNQQQQREVVMNSEPNESRMISDSTTTTDDDENDDDKFDDVRWVRNNVPATSNVKDEIVQHSSKPSSYKESMGENRRSTKGGTFKKHHHHAMMDSSTEWSKIISKPPIGVVRYIDSTNHMIGDTDWTKVEPKPPVDEVCFRNNIQYGTTNDDDDVMDLGRSNVVSKPPIDEIRFLSTPPIVEERYISSKEKAHTSNKASGRTNHNNRQRQAPEDDDDEEEVMNRRENYYGTRREEQAVTEEDNDNDSDERLLKIRAVSTFVSVEKRRRDKRDFMIAQHQRKKSRITAQKSKSQEYQDQKVSSPSKIQDASSQVEEERGNSRTKEEGENRQTMEGDDDGPTMKQKTEQTDDNKRERVVAVKKESKRRKNKVRKKKVIDDVAKGVLQETLKRGITKSRVAARKERREKRHNEMGLSITKKVLFR